jgi:hypothetical protein
MRPMASGYSKKALVMEESSTPSTTFSGRGGLVRSWSSCVM